MTPQPTLVLDRVLRVMQPLVRLLLRNGVTYTVFAAALKRVFLQAAQAELSARGMASTDSALTVLSGVHRRDVRQLLRGAPEPAAAPADPGTDAPAAAVTLPEHLGLAAQVVGRWMQQPEFLDDRGRPLVLPRTGPAGSFESLVAGVSRDVRPRAVLDELLRLGVVHERADGLALDGSGFAPRQGFEELSWLFAANLQDHAAAAVANLSGEANFLEQAVFVDELTEASVQKLREAASLAWQQAFRTVMQEAQVRFDGDAALPAGTPRAHRARFGVYFYSTAETPPAPAGPAAPATPARQPARPRARQEKPSA